VTVDYEDRRAPSGSPADLTLTPQTVPPRKAQTPSEGPPSTRRERVRTTIGRLITAINASDDDAVEQAVLRLSQTRRYLAPLALIVGAFMMLFQGLKLLVTNWRLTLVQIIPAMWIWFAMLDIKIHLLHGKSFHVIRGPILIPVILGVTALTAASFFLNAVFAFAISETGPPNIRRAFDSARRHLGVILTWGCGVGLALSFSALIATRWGRWPFAISQSIVVGIMMVCYVAVPARLVGIKQTQSRRDKLAAAAVGGAVGAVVCSPPYLLGRLGILMLGWSGFFWVGILFIVIGAAFQTGATSAVKAVKFSAKLVGSPTKPATATSTATSDIIP
jgi:hypothetical protein